ncbi:pleckstrin homology domain-containing family A member 3-like isoform X2 [Hyla sarda]|uniref:pleckstrin homology domain-containing family A member 3-like isoform X2 n=1 Tax=Hyla sarda TaxID=327740 RepID=UPI0024C45ED7|nr:pleckstrin homology domain-containing family A member 3-like isoform X2 [Hyla sarda]
MRLLDMEGSLLKWTNYLSVHQADSCRMDLYIPKEQCFYLRADNVADRQRWLVALGSAKACLGDIESQKSKDVLPDNDSLSRKLSELRLFCDLLMGQVAEVKEAVTTEETGAAPNKEKLNTACSNLQGTCSYICSTLDECITYVNTSLHLQKQDPPLPVLPGDVVGSKLPLSRKVKRSLSQPVESAPPRTPNSPRQGDGVTVIKNLEQMAMRLHSQERKYLAASNATSG